MMFMRVPMDILYLLLFVYLLEFSACCVELPLPKLRPTLIYQSFISINLPTLYQCLELCVSYKLCRNVFFVERTGRCVLNSEDTSRQYPWLAGYYHLVMSRTDIPQGIGGACSGHTCAIDEMCIQAGQTYLCVKHGYPTVKCPAKWGREGDLCFFVITGNMTWKEAKDFCASTGAELLTFDSSDDYSYHKKWTAYRLHSIAKRKIAPGKVWTGVKYEPPMPSWMTFNPPVTSDTNLCIGIAYNNTGKTFLSGDLSAVSCDERNGVACQHRNPEQWP